jgi:hypothetical protein
MRLSVEFIRLRSKVDLAYRLTGFTIINPGELGMSDLYALFAVTNAGKDASIWFDTASVEQKTEAGWQRIVPTRSSWGGITSDCLNMYWPPGYGCFYAVAWPPGIPTNAPWRLKVKYGKAPSPLATKIADNLGLKFIAPRRQERTVSTLEVRQ